MSAGRFRSRSLVLSIRGWQQAETTMVPARCCGRHLCLKRRLRASLFCSIFAGQGGAETGEPKLRNAERGTGQGLAGSGSGAIAAQFHNHPCCLNQSLKSWLNRRRSKSLNLYFLSTSGTSVTIFSAIILRRLSWSNCIIYSRSSIMSMERSFFCFENRIRCFKFSDARWHIKIIPISATDSP